MKKIVQCVPNFSEGIKIDVIEKIVEPLKNQDGFKLISYESDQDYNRTVVTIIGDPDSMILPLVNFFEQALIHIDMNFQKGQHPRMGAVDVVPFIPIENVTDDECIEVAKTLSDQISKKLNIPIFLYAKAATQKNRVKLPQIRKGEFEGMKEKIKLDIWKPDFGTSKVHETFGVSAIGVRDPLIAYNIDIPNATATAINLSQNIDIGDFAYNITNNLLYGVLLSGVNQGALVSLNPASGAVTNIGGTNSIFNIRAMMATNAGEIYGINFGSSIYQFNLLTGERVRITPSNGTFYQDAAHCVTAPLIIDADLEITKTDKIKIKR